MARSKDENKRSAILAEAKRLFSLNGFEGTSIADIVNGLDIPIGSVYTYFSGKNELIHTVIEEGWAEFWNDLKKAVEGESLPERRLSVIVNDFLPRLFRDVELISLIMQEAERYADLSTKLSTLTGLISSLIKDLSVSRGLALDFDERQAMTALTIFFLGSMDTIRLAKRTGLPVGEEDVLNFIRMAIGNSFGVRV